MTLKSQAVLFRAAHHSAALEIELTRRNIPFVKFGGLKFLDSVHVKDVLAVLRWAENPRDRVAGFRVVQLLPGVGPATAAKVLDEIVARAGSGNPADTAGGALAAFAAPARAQEDWHPFVRLMSSVYGRQTPGPPSSKWCGAGTSRISSAITKTRRSVMRDVLQMESIAAHVSDRVNAF